MQLNLYDTMEQQSSNNQNKPQKRPVTRRNRLRLPFDNRRQDPVNWIYDNRIGLCVTVIAFLVGAIVFVTAKIVTKIQTPSDTIFIEMEFTEVVEEKQKEEKEKPKQQPRTNIDYSTVRNLSSNESAEEEELKEVQNVISDKELREAAAKAEQGMRDNLAAYEQGLADADAVASQTPRESTNNEAESGKTSRRRGNVTVSYSFTDPTRHATYLVKPAYRCEGGGEVIVEAVLNQSGKVISAKVQSGGDACMRQTAVQAALGSRFDINNNAPKKHEGTITYIFIPQ